MALTARLVDLRDQRHLPGKHDQKTHGRGPRLAPGVTGQAALDAVPHGTQSADLTSDERGSLHAYTQPQHFLTINGSLRGEILHGAAPAGPVSDRHIANLDHVMQKSRTTENIEVWRGLQGGADKVFGANRLAGNMKGLEWHEKGFMSTTVRKTAAQEFTQSSGAVLMRVTAPKGTGAAKLAYHVRDGEGEVVLERGLKLRVTADHGIDPGWGHCVLDVEVVPE